jgi:sugar phosphate isomerase/epimerase
MIELCYITGEMSDDFEKALQLGTDAGINTVQLRMGLFGKLIHQLGNDDIPRIKDTLAKHNMNIGMLLPPFAKCNIEDTETVAEHHKIFRRTIEIAHALGTNRIRIFPFQSQTGTRWNPPPLEDYLDLIVENLMPAAKHAEAEGITMCMEVINGTIGVTAAHTRQIIDALGSKAVKAIWEIDTGWHCHESPTQGYPHLKGLIQDVHVKINDKGELDPIGDTGEVYADVVHQLVADDYSGMMTIEHWPGEEGTLKGLRQLGKILKQAQN